MILKLLTAIVVLAASAAGFAQAPSVPTQLPGKGLAQHDFLYAGESHERNIYIVRGGKIAWSYSDPAGKGEISDAVMLSNGNILFAHQFAVEEIAPDKKVVWKYEPPAGREVHTAVPIGTQRVLYIENGDPALLRVVNICNGGDGEGDQADYQTAAEHAWAVPSRPADQPGNAAGGAHGPEQGGGV